jgi:FAD/FMN-containing dehydrogenase
MQDEAFVTRRLFAGVLTDAQILDDEASRESFGQDWSQVLDPDASLVLLPRTSEEVAACLRVCSDHGISVVPSGGRTGLSGGAVAARGEVVLSLQKLDFISEPDPMTHTLRVGAGAVTQAVHDRCRPLGLTWPVDFGSKGSSQIGGNLSTNAGGIHVIRYGNTRNWVLSLKLALMSGELLELNGELEKNNTGYDLKNLVIGSEGTLGVVTEATLKLTPLLADTKLFVFALKSLAEVTELLTRCRRQKLDLVAFEYMSRRCFETSLDFAALAHPFASENLDGAEAFAWIECLGEVPEEWFVSLFDSGLVVSGLQSRSPAQSRDLWRLREGVAEAIMASASVHQHDVSVPVRRLPEFSRVIDEFYATKYPSFEVFVFGHIGDGNLHIFIRKPRNWDAARFVTEVSQSDLELFELVRSFRGSVSAEHGIGLLKKKGLPYSRTESERRIFRVIKSAFDPQGLLNPGKILDP